MDWETFLWLALGMVESYIKVTKANESVNINL